MRKIKKLAALCMAGVMAASMTACSGGETAETTTAAPATTAAETTAEETTAEETSAAAETEASGEAAAEAFDPEAEHGPIFTDLAENGVLKVGIIGNSPTFCFHTVENGEDTLVGFEVAGMYEMADRLSEYMGRDITVEFTETDFTGCMSALQANQIHFVTRLSPTDERKETWLFTNVYHKSDECYVGESRGSGQRQVYGNPGRRDRLRYNGIH